MNYVKRKTLTIGNDCDECCFSMLCINPCDLEQGMHYEKRKQD